MCGAGERNQQQEQRRKKLFCNKNALVRLFFISCCCRCCWCILGRSFFLSLCSFQVFQRSKIKNLRVWCTLLCQGHNLAYRHLKKKKIHRMQMFSCSSREVRSRQNKFLECTTNEKSNFMPSARVNDKWLFHAFLFLLFQLASIIRSNHLSTDKPS